VIGGRLDILWSPGGAVAVSGDQRLVGDTVESLEATIARLLAAGDLRSAATAIMRGYGPAILGYLAALARQEDRADDVFSQFSEDLWTGLPGFRQESSVRTWVHKLAWHAWLRYERDAFRRHGRRLASDHMSRLAAEVRSTTALHLRSDVKDAVSRLRAELAPAEQSLLVLRIDRGLSWTEVASVMSTPDEPLDSQTVAKRFQRVKERLRNLAEREGLLQRS
jgi:RNA polymerase sigma-70 factor (ECF subfamily)